VINGVWAILYQDKKFIWPPLPLWIDPYKFENTKKSQYEVDKLHSYHFREEGFRRHDQKKVVKEHFSKYGVPLEYNWATWEEEEVYYGTRTYDEVISKRQ